MDSEILETKTKKLNCMAQLQIFELFKEYHLKENHEANNIYICSICSDYCEDLLDQFLYNKQELDDDDDDVFDQEL